MKPPYRSTIPSVQVAARTASSTWRIAATVSRISLPVRAERVLLGLHRPARALVCHEEALGNEPLHPDCLTCRQEVVGALGPKAVGHRSAVEVPRSIGPMAVSSWTITSGCALATACATWSASSASATTGSAPRSRSTAALGGMPRHAVHLVARIDQPRHKLTPDGTGGSCDKHLHGHHFLVDGHLYPCDSPGSVLVTPRSSRPHDIPLELEDSPAPGEADGTSDSDLSGGRHTPSAQDAAGRPGLDALRPRPHTVTGPEGTAIQPEQQRQRGADRVGETIEAPGHHGGAQAAWAGGGCSPVSCWAWWVLLSSSRDCRRCSTMMSS